MMIKNVSSIGILDINYSSVSILDELSKKYPNEMFYYLNDFSNANFDEWSHRAVLERIKEDVGILLSYNPKLIIVLGSIYFDYANDYFLSLNIPVINIGEVITEEVNKEYPKKNILVLADSNAQHNTYYQRNINYLHFYQVEANELERVILYDKVKTGVSFDIVKKTFADFSRKAVDLIVCASCNLCLLNTEYKENMPRATMFNTTSVIIRKIESSLDTNDNIRSKGKGRINILLDKQTDIEEIKYLFNPKYYIKLK